MSHLSQLVSEALALAKITEDFVKSEPQRDRTKLTHEGKTYYVVCLSEDDMEKIKGGLEVGYEDQPFADVLIEKFAV